MAGTVVERNVAVGGQVSASQEQPLLTIADLSTVWIVADVYEQDLPRVQKGDQADISVLALPDRRFVGTIDYVGSVVDLQTRTAQARIEFKNDDLALRPGMFARMDVHGKAEGVSEVPSSAILARRDQYFVFVRQKDGTYLEREVHVGDQHGQHTTILSGLVPGEDVVTEGAILLDAEAHEAL
jgi:RND family efflux transporter MFP subunit